MPTARYLDHPYLLAGRRIDPITGTLSYRDVQKHLRRKELEVLALLAEAGDSFVPRSTFIEQIWHGNPIGEQGLTDTISSLRRSLLDTDRDHPIVLTIPRRGYQLRASIRWISRDGGVAFVAGSVIDGRPDWRLKQLLKQTEAHESWLAEDGRSRRIFRFCCNEQQLRKLRREIVLMRYLREALAGQKHVSTILDWQLEEPPYFLELAAPASGNLRGVMLSKSPPARAERWKLLQQVAEALAAVHAAGIVHRNLTPDSILVDRRDGERVALLGEFGSAALDDRQRLVDLGIDPGELSLQTQQLDEATVYVAPECVAGAPATAASDVYALGAVIAQTLCGDFQRLEFSDVEDLPAEVTGLLQRCSAVNPATRPTAAELAAALRELSEPKPVRWQIERAAEPLAAALPAEVPDSVPAPADALAASAADLGQPASAPAEPASPTPVPAPEPAADAAKAAPVSPQAAAPIALTQPGFAPPIEPPQIHDRIGRYRILNELAQGGMGVVYLAEQNEPVQRRVALKLIRAGLDSAQVLARFAAERQALALMNHPNISAIFDAGTTPGGYPYFVMEFVPGKDIKTHCDDAKLSIRGRIRLFLQVCDGVLHAHQKGLIHRDLKPSNILVKQRSEQPALVKLIDFGIAKSLTGGLGAGLHTRIGSFVGTPVYSSPEQVTDPTRDIDTRADLYSLGVVLYEILTGVPPRSAQELDADTPAELARRLRDTKTPAMGTRYSGLSPAEQQQIAELRALSTDGLSMQLCSDLDWIVGKCIALDPDDRYATVQDLRLDLQRWLDDRPIEARPTNAWYRLRKMVRRNRLNTALIAGATLGLIGTSAAAVIAYQQADEARRNAESAAAFQSAQMKSVDLTFLGEQLRKDMENAARASGKADPEAFLSGIDFMDLSLRQLNASLLEPALSAAEVQFKDNPEVHSQLLHSLAEVSYQLGDYQKAERAATKALQLRQLEFGEDDRRTLESAASLAAIKWQEDEVEEAEALIRNATTRMRATLGSDDPLLASSLNRLARILVAAGKLDEARELLKANSKKFETIFSAHNIHAMEALNQYGNVLADQSQLVEARAALTTLLERRRGALGDTHRDTLNTMNDLGLVLRDQGEIAAASEYLKSALEGYRRIAGEFHPDTVQIAGNYSGLLFRAGKLREAEELAWQVMKARDRTFGEYHSNSLPTAMNLGRFLNEQGRAAEAEALIRAFVKRHEKSPLLPHLELRLVTALRLQGKLDAAEDLARQIMSGAESAPQGYIPWLATDELGLIMAANGRFKEAESLHREAYSRLREMFGETDTSTLASVANLVRALIAQEKIAEARAVGEFLVANARKIYPEGHYLHGVYLTLDALMLSASNRFEEAEARFEEAWKLLDATPELDPEHKRFLATAVSKLDERWKMLQPGPTTPRPWRTQLENAGSMQSG